MAKLTIPFDAAAIAPHPRPEVSTDGPERLAATRYQHVPDALRSTPSWMASINKVPHCVTRNGHLHSLAKADPHDPANHCSFENAVAAVERGNGGVELFFVLGVGNNFVCVDLDDLEKVAPAHQADANEYQRQIKERLTGTYCEVSRSGKGLHYIGIAPEVNHDKAYAKHPHFHVDLLFRHGLVLTGDLREGTTEITDISSQVRTILNSMIRRPSPEAATLPSVDTLTPAHCDEARLISILSAERFKHGEAFRTGQNVYDWSGTFAALLNTAAEFCTDEQLVLRVLTRSKFVQMAEDKGGETRLAKVQRLWPSQWPKALERTEPTRRANRTATALTKPLTLADLWDQSPYVQFMVQDRAITMITEGLIAGLSAEGLAPLFRYLRPEKMNRLQDELRRVDEVFAKTMTDARVLTLSDTDTEVAELNAYMNRCAVEEAKIDRKNRFKQYNREYYIVENFGGSAKVFRDEFHLETGAQVFWSVNAFCEAKINDKMLAGWELSKDDKRPQLTQAARAWVQSDSSRRYIAQEMHFETTARELTVETGKILNHFRGWATAPVAGDWSAIRYLIHNILCSGVAAASDYLLNYLAHMVQQPQHLPGAAIILQSEEEGTGKTTFIDLLRRMIGARYCITTPDAEALVGKHNDAAMNKVLLHFEEAVAPNDRVLESKVKALITNEILTYNPKHIAAMSARNYARVFLTSNAKQVAHLPRHDRRWFVLRVSPKHTNDPAFWGPFNAQYPREIEAFMHALQVRDISDFNPKKVPYTEAKDAQKMESVVGPEAILRRFLEDGRLPVCSQFNGAHWLVRNTALSDYFNKYNLKIGYKPPQPGKVFKPVALGESRQRLAVNGHPAQQFRVLHLPPLQEARAAFLDHLNVASYDWGDGADAEWTLE